MDILHQPLIVEDTCVVLKRDGPHVYVEAKPTELLRMGNDRASHPPSVWILFSIGGAMYCKIIARGAQWQAKNLGSGNVDTAWKISGQESRQDQGRKPSDLQYHIVFTQWL